MEKYILSDVNKLLAGSNLYCEPLDMFIQYAKYLYSLLNGKHFVSWYTPNENSGSRTRNPKHKRFTLFYAI